MALYPLLAYERNPFGLVPLKSSVSVEGGMVGELVNDGAGLPEVDLWGDSGTGTYQLSLVGLVDDSTSGRGYGAAVYGTPIAPGVTPETGTPAGPPTHLASGKVTLWTDSGFYVTDVFDSALGDLSGVAPGTLLYSGTGASKGLLTTAGSDELGRFVRRFVGGIGSVDDFDSWFIPRVQPLPAGRVYMVLKFK